MNENAISFSNSINQPSSGNPVFRFVSYYLDRASLTASFVYQGIDNIFFTEKIHFAKKADADKKTVSILPPIPPLINCSTVRCFLPLS